MTTRNRRGPLGLITLVALALGGSLAEAAPVLYTDYQSFLNDLPRKQSTLNFDDLSYPRTIMSGDTVEGIRFTYDLSFQRYLTVGQEFFLPETTSSPNYLGTTNRELFYGGDAFDIAFRPTNAIGMFFMVGDNANIANGDITLSAASVTAGLDLSDVQLVLPNTIAYFLGIIDDHRFGNASVASRCCMDFLFSVDDITRSVPEPTSGLLLASGLGLLSVNRRRRSRSA